MRYYMAPKRWKNDPLTPTAQDGDGGVAQLCAAEAGGMSSAAGNQ